MDEPTSSMDAQTEQQFIHQLKGVVTDRTLVVVTHRPALLDLVDRIVVMDAGKVIVDGPKMKVLAALASQRPAQRNVPGAAEVAGTVGAPMPSATSLNVVA